MIKVFIDQGHNPTNPNAGAEGNGLREQDIVYEVGRRLAILLNANPNYEARLSRNSPTEILGTSIAESLRLRVDAANSWGADIFISIHANASEISTASGVRGIRICNTVLRLQSFRRYSRTAFADNRSYKPRNICKTDSLCSA